MENQYHLVKFNNKIKINLNLEIIKNKCHINNQIKDNQYLQMIEINNKLEFLHPLKDILIENKLVQLNKHNFK